MKIEVVKKQLCMKTVSPGQALFFFWSFEREGNFCARDLVEDYQDSIRTSSTVFAQTRWVPVFRTKWEVTSNENRSMGLIIKC